MPAREGESFRTAERAIARFQEAAAVESLKGEALLRAGHVQLRLSRYDAALASWKELERAHEEPAMLFLLHLFRGMALEGRGRVRRGSRVLSKPRWRSARRAFGDACAWRRSPFATVTATSPTTLTDALIAERRSAPRSLVVLLRRATGASCYPRIAQAPGVREAPMRRLLVSALLALSVATAAAQQVFQSGVDAVIIPVAVRSGNKPVTGLTAADFELRDNGVVQEIRSVAAESIPIDVTLLLDLSSSVDGPMLQRLKTAVADTAALLRSDDRIRLVAISQVLREVFPLLPKSGAMPLDTLRAEGATSLYDGLAATMMRATEPGRRQLIVAFTDGRDSTSVIDEKHREGDRAD